MAALMQVSTWKAKVATASALQKKHNPDVLFMKTNRFVFVFATFSALIFPSSLPAFEGRIHVLLTRGAEAAPLLYTAGTNTLRIERTDTGRPYAKNLIALDTGAITLLFPHNRSFVRLKNSGANPAAPVPVQPGMPSAGLPPGIGPQAGATPPGTPALPNLPAAGGMPAMPMMPPPMMEKMELTATGEKTNLLGYACTRYEIKQRGEVMEIWATDQLLPYQPWQPNQPPRFGPRMIEEQWSELVRARKLFPLFVSLKFENGPERLRFEVKTITPEKIADPDGALFQPPADYHELDPLPF